MLQHARHAEAGHARPAVGNNHVAQMNRAMHDAARVGSIDRVSDAGHEPYRARRPAGGAAEHDIDRIAGDILRHQIRHAPLGARVERGKDCGIVEADPNDVRQCAGKPIRLLRREIQSERLDGDGAVLVGVGGAKEGPENANPNLMNHPIPAECIRCRLRTVDLACQS